MNARAAQGNGLEPAVGAFAARLDATLTRVLESLEAEARALATRQPEELLQIVAVKRRALQELERLGQDPRLGPCLDPRRSPLGADAAAALRARLDSCQRLNLATGGAIVTARRDNEQVLRLLGHAPDVPAYGVRGQNPAGAPSRTLGRA